MFPNHESAPKWTNRKLAGRIPELDGIRGLAILLVLIFHYIVEVASFNVDGRIRTTILCFALTWSGVDLFFVLSGFLIGGILLDAKHADNYYRTFYFRRISRIVPLYAVLIATFIIGAYCVPSASKPLAAMFDTHIPTWSYFFFLQNVFMTLHRSYGSGWMSVTWSLAVEEHFYLLLPFVVRRLSSKGIAAFAIGMIVVAPALRGILAHYAVSGLAMYTLFPCRADALGGGLLVAIACRNRTMWTWLTSHRRYCYAAFTIFGVGILAWTVVYYNLGYGWMAAFYTSLLVLVVANPGCVERRVFRSAVLVKLGTVAYAVYLFHPGILRLCHYLCFGAIPINDNWRTAGTTALSLAATLLVAGISWRVLEKPLIQRARLRYRYGTEP